MNKYFEEKYSQVDPNRFKAFGIELYSRYGEVYEIIEMLNFARLAAVKDVAQYIIQVFYDSKVSMCKFEFVHSFNENDPAAEIIKEAALESIGQFMWFGINEHGAPLEEYLDSQV